jgi:hypothetical protein
VPSKLVYKSSSEIVMKVLTFILIVFISTFKVNAADEVICELFAEEEVGFSLKNGTAKKTMFNKRDYRIQLVKNKFGNDTYSLVLHPNTERSKKFFRLLKLNGMIYGVDSGNNNTFKYFEDTKRYVIAWNANFNRVASSLETGKCY